MADGLGVRVAGYRQAAGGAGTEIPRTPISLPWSHTDSEDSDYFSLSGAEITFKKAGHYYVFYWVRLQAAGVAGRRLVLGSLALNGVVEWPGRGLAYLRDNGNAVTGGMHGRGILGPAAGDKLTLVLQRVDTSGAGNPQLFSALNGRTGISIVRLDESWDYARYFRGSLDVKSSGSWDGHSWIQTVEEDIATFELNSPIHRDQIELKQTGKYMVCVTLPCADLTKRERANCSARITWDSTQILSQVSDTIRRRDGCDFAALTMAGIFHVPTANKFLTVEFSGLGETFKVGAISSIELVKLPDTGDYLRLRNTSGTHRADLDSDAIEWDAQDEVDAGSFTHTIGANGHKVGLVQDGRYLFFAQGNSERTAADLDRLLHRFFWYKESTGRELIRGAAQSYDRGLDLGEPPLDSVRAGMHACLLSVAGTSADIISIRHNQDAGGNVDSSCLFEADGLHLQAVNLNTIMPLKIEALGQVEAHGRASLSVVSSLTIEARGLVSCHARANLGATKHAAAIGDVSAHVGTAPLAVIRQAFARGGRVSAQGEAALAVTRGIKALGIVEARPGTAPLAITRRVQAKGIVVAADHVTLAVTRRAGAIGQIGVHGVVPLSRLMGAAIKARGIVAAHGNVVLSTIRSLEALGVASVLTTEATLSTSVGVQIKAKGFINAHGRAKVSVTRGLELKGQAGAHVESALSAIRGIEAKAIVGAHGIAEASLSASIAIHARGLISCHARAQLSATRGLEALGDASAEARVANISRIRGLVARGLAGAPTSSGALSVLRRFQARGLFSSLAIADPNRVVRFHARGLVQAITSRMIIGDQPLGTFYSNTAKVCRKRLREQWGAVEGISVSYDNLPFSKSPKTLHAVSAVVFGPGTTEVSDVSMPEDHVTAQGMLEVTIRAPFPGGQDSAEAAADALVTAFRKVRVGVVHFTEPSVELQGKQGTYFDALVRCPFWAEDSRARLAPVGPDVSGDRDATATALRTRVRTHVAEPESIAVQYENMPFDKPAATEWMRTAIVEGQTFEPEGAGGSTGTHRTAGILFLDVFTPFGTGEARILEVIDAIDDAFRVVSVQGIELQEPTVDRGLRLGAEWRRTVAIPYLADEIT